MRGFGRTNQKTHEMEEQVNKIQSIINNKADEKLKSELRRLHNELYNGEGYKLLKDISINVGSHDKPKTIALCSILGENGFWRQIIEKNTERYRKEETELFVKQVESLRHDVDNLLNQDS